MRRLYRDSLNGLIGGVCEGLGEYFSIDPIIFRLIFIASFFMLGGGILDMVINYYLPYFF